MQLYFISDKNTDRTNAIVPVPFIKEKKLHKVFSILNHFLFYQCNHWESSYDDIHISFTLWFFDKFYFILCFMMVYNSIFVSFDRFYSILCFLIDFDFILSWTKIKEDTPRLKYIFLIKIKVNRFHV